MMRALSSGPCRKPVDTAALISCFHERLAASARDLASWSPVAASSIAELSSEELSGEDMGTQGAEPAAEPTAFTAHIQRMSEALKSEKLTQRRRLADYHALLESLAKVRKPYLTQDVFDEMRLDGVCPSWQSFGIALSNSLLQRNLSLAHHFFKEMQRHGFHPTVGTCTVVITTAGHAGQLRYALQLVEQMQDRQVPITDKIQRALLSCYANTNDTRSALKLLDEFIMTRTRLDVHLFMEAIRSVRVEATRSDTEKVLEKREAMESIEWVLLRAMQHLDLEDHPQERDMLLRYAQDAYNRLGAYEAARDAYSNMEDPDSSSFRSHFASYFESGKAEVAKEAAGDMQFAKDCFANAMRVLTEMEAKGHFIKLFHVANFILGVLSVGERTGGEPIRWTHYNGEELEWTPNEMCEYVLQHMEASDQFISELYGSQLLRNLTHAKTGGSVQIADAVFDSMVAKGDWPSRNACTDYANYKGAHDPGDHERIDKALELAKTARDARTRRQPQAQPSQTSEELDW